MSLSNLKLHSSLFPLTDFDFGASTIVSKYSSISITLGNNWVLLYNTYICSLEKYRRPVLQMSLLHLFFFHLFYNFFFGWGGGYNKIILSAEGCGWLSLVIQILDWFGFSKLEVSFTLEYRLFVDAECGQKRWVFFL